jgi:hypothetical protein
MQTHGYVRGDTAALHEGASLLWRKIAEFEPLADVEWGEGCAFGESVKIQSGNEHQIQSRKSVVSLTFVPIAKHAKEVSVPIEFEQPLQLVKYQHDTAIGHSEQFLYVLGASSGLWKRRPTRRERQFQVEFVGNHLAEALVKAFLECSAIEQFEVNERHLLACLLRRLAGVSNELCLAHLAWAHDVKRNSRLLDATQHLYGASFDIANQIPRHDRRSGADAASGSRWTLDVTP